MATTDRFGPNPERQLWSVEREKQTGHSNRQSADAPGIGRVYPCQL
jgi:hypothetical protein